MRWNRVRFHLIPFARTGDRGSTGHIPLATEPMRHPSTTVHSRWTGPMPMKSAFLPSQSTNPGLPPRCAQVALRHARGDEIEHEVGADCGDATDNTATTIGVAVLMGSTTVRPPTPPPTNNTATSEGGGGVVGRLPARRRPARQRGEKPYKAVFVRFPELRGNGRASLACRPDGPVIRPGIISLQPLVTCSRPRAWRLGCAGTTGRRVSSPG